MIMDGRLETESVTGTNATVDLALATVDMATVDMATAG